MGLLGPVQVPVSGLTASGPGEAAEVGIDDVSVVDVAQGEPEIGLLDDVEHLARRLDALRLARVALGAVEQIVELIAAGPCDLVVGLRNRQQPSRLHVSQHISRPSLLSCAHALSLIL